MRASRSRKYDIHGNFRARQPTDHFAHDAADCDKEAPSGAKASRADLHNATRDASARALHPVATDRTVDSQACGPACWNPWSRRLPAAESVRLRSACSLVADPDRSRLPGLHSARLETGLVAAARRHETGRIDSAGQAPLSAAD